MRSFPSALNRGGNSAIKINGSSTSVNRQSSDGQEISMEDYDKLSMYNHNLNNYVKEALYNEGVINIAKNTSRIPMYNMKNSIGSVQKELMTIENPFHIPAASIGHINKYRFIYKNPLHILYGSAQESDKKGSTTIAVMDQVVTPSLFNPKFFVQSVGMDENVPLLSNVKSKQISKRQNPTIKNLVNDSRRQNGNLGTGRFMPVDFMFCKDLGKVPNNHLVVLRKYAHPVGDNIYKYSTHKYLNTKTPGQYDYSAEEDVARLVTWFGTEDNKLEDILHYDYKATWRELEAKRQWQDSQEDSEDRGFLGLLANMNPSYNSNMSRGLTGQHNLVNIIGGKMHLHYKPNNEALAVAGDYDQNKVYEPKNTVQKTYTYEGKLEENHEITLNFCYKLRAYDNINTKAAMLDLLGNIFEVTYRRGHFWGGDRHIKGAQPNPAAWKTAQAFIDNSWDELGGLMKGLTTGNWNFTAIMGSISDAATKLLAGAVNAAAKMVGLNPPDSTQHIANAKSDNTKVAGKEAKNGAKKAVSGAKNAGKKIANSNDKAQTVNQMAGNTLSGILKTMSSMNNITGFTNGLKGALQSTLGRPSIYAWNSLLSGDNVGLWHLTIGNPYNPIISLGNLILEDTTVVQSGPLGIEDFPSEIKVTCKLKLGRSRDLTELEKMYTKGMGSIYAGLGGNKLANFFPLMSNEKNVEKDVAEYMKQRKKETMATDAATNKTAQKNIQQTQQKEAIDAQSDSQISTDDSGGQTVSPGAASKSKHTDRTISDQMLQAYNGFDKNGNRIKLDREANDYVQGDIPFNKIAAGMEVGFGGGADRFQLIRGDIYQDTGIWDDVQTQSWYYKKATKYKK